MSRRYAGEAADPVRAARELGVGHVVTGHYTREGDDLRVSLETIDATGTRVVWKDGVTVPRHDMLALRGSLAERVRTGLLPALGISAESSGVGTLPSNAKAYDLYLRSLGLEEDEANNPVGIELLKQALALDPHYAPAWAALSSRYYEAASYLTRSAAERQRLFDLALETIERAREIDPGLVEALTYEIVYSTEQGRLNEAYDRAAAFLEQRPQSARAHFTMSYVYRYAGLAEEAAARCESAYALDPTDPFIRSCGLAFMMVNDYDRALEALAVDPNSVISRWNSAWARIRKGEVRDVQAALLAANPELAGPRLALIGCPSGERTDLDADDAETLLDNLTASTDPENMYWSGVQAARCGHFDFASRCLAAGIARGYCAYPAMETEPFLDAFRDDPRYAGLRDDGRACRQAFVDYRARSGRVARGDAPR